MFAAKRAILVIFKGVGQIAITDRTDIEFVIMCKCIDGTPRLWRVPQIIVPTVCDDCPVRRVYQDDVVSLWLLADQPLIVGNAKPVKNCGISYKNPCKSEV